MLSRQDKAFWSKQPSEVLKVRLERAREGIASLEAELSTFREVKGFLEDVLRARASAAAEIQRKRDRNARQIKNVEARNARLEMEHNRNTWAE